VPRVVEAAEVWIPPHALVVQVVPLGLLLEEPLWLVELPELLAQQVLMVGQVVLAIRLQLMKGAVGRAVAVVVQVILLAQQV